MKKKNNRRNEDFKIDAFELLEMLLTGDKENVLREILEKLYNLLLCAERRVYLKDHEDDTGNGHRTKRLPWKEHKKNPRPGSGALAP